MFREAIAALYGLKPKQSYTIQGLIDLAYTKEELRLQVNEEILETRSPTQDGEIEASEAERSWTLLNSFPRYDDISDEFKSPAKWVQRASYGGLKIAREWQVIFPYSFKVTIGVSLQQEPDHRNFIDFLTRDVELPLKDLVCYGLNIHPDRFQQTPDCGDLLANIYSELRNEIDVSDIDELRDKKMPVSSFLGHCQRYNHSLHAKCVGWSSWMTQHAELRNHLSGVSRQHLWNIFSSGLRECFCSS